VPVVQEKWSSAGAHARGVDDELVQVCALLEMVDDWCGFTSFYKQTVGLTSTVIPTIIEM